MDTVLAGHASALLDYYSKLVPTNGAAVQIHEQLLDTAIQSVLMIRQMKRMKHLVQLKHSGTVEEPEETKINAACVVCCSRVTSVVVTPCMHLALCMVSGSWREWEKAADGGKVCCDVMEIKAKDVVGRKTVPCPVCRMGVMDRVGCSLFWVAAMD